MITIFGGHEVSVNAIQIYYWTSEKPNLAVLLGYRQINFLYNRLLGEENNEIQKQRSVTYLGTSP